MPRQTPARPSCGRRPAPSTAWSPRSRGPIRWPGFAVDDQLPILWAREPGTGATIGMYADVPVHVDEYDPTEPGNNQFSADYPGYVRDRLAQLFGGTEVIAAGTLGRQETIGAAGNYAEVAEQGRFITNAVTRALTNAHRITDTTLAAANQSFSTAAENQGLLAAMSCNHPDGPLGCPGPLSEPASNDNSGTWDWRAVGGIFTVNRSLDAPYFTAPGRIGTSATVARVGDQVYATAPGEAFPEVTAAIQRSFAASPGISAAHIIDHGSDQLGYYWDQRPGVYPSAQLAQSDFARFNVGSHLAQDNVDAVRAAGEAPGPRPDRRAGLRADRQPERVLAALDPVLSRPGRERRPGGELLRHGQEGAGVRLSVDVHRIDRGNAGRRRDQLGLR